MTVAKPSGSLSYFLKIAWVILEPWVISKMMDTFNSKWLILSLKSKICLEYMSILAILIISLSEKNLKLTPFFSFCFQIRPKTSGTMSFLLKIPWVILKNPWVIVGLELFLPWVILPAHKQKACVRPSKASSLCLLEISRKKKSSVRYKTYLV